MTMRIAGIDRSPPKTWWVLGRGAVEAGPFGTPNEALDCVRSWTRFYVIINIAFPCKIGPARPGLFYVHKPGKSIGDRFFPAAWEQADTDRNLSRARAIEAACVMDARPSNRRPFD